MLAKRITSLQHPLVKQWVMLRKERSMRKKMQKALIMGEKTIRECPLPLLTLISRESPPADLPAKEQYLVADAVFRKITGLAESDGLAAVVALPDLQEFSHPCRYILILDQIQDPGNLGTLLRSALALGWDGVIATEETVDCFNDKALRASRGAVFHLPLTWKKPEEILAWVKQKKMHFWIADLQGEPFSRAKFVPPLALLLSGEGKGVRKWALKMGQKVSIPMDPRVESLNVASAGAILLHAMREAHF